MLFIKQQQESFVVVVFLEKPIFHKKP